MERMCVVVVRLVKKKRCQLGVGPDTSRTEHVAGDGEQGKAWGSIHLPGAATLGGAGLLEEADVARRVMFATAIVATRVGCADPGYPASRSGPAGVRVGEFGVRNVGVRLYAVQTDLAVQPV